MKFAPYSQQDWLLIRNQIVWLGAAMLVAGVLLLGTQIYLYFSEQEQRTAQQQLQQARANADAAQLAWDTIEQHQTEFKALQQLHLLGDERRLDWIEALSVKAKTRPELKLLYQFAPQRTLEQSTPINQFQVYASSMMLGFVAMNETVFSEMAQWLNQQAGYAVPAVCQMQRADEGIAMNCEYLWLTIAPVKAEVTQ